jgi:predicted NUDIX family phosphoesterase
MSEEEVLVVPAEAVERIGAFSGFQSHIEPYMSLLEDRRLQSFRPRSQVETDPSFKQLIPYTIVCHRQTSGTLVFQYTRGSGQGEQRLHAKRSIGIGGHISTEDTQGDDWYRSGMLRELAEEVDIGSPYRDRIVGLIYDDSNDVGRVHLGVVHLLELDQPLVTPREDQLLEAGLVDTSRLWHELDRLETWSQLCLEHLFRAS